MYFSCTKNLDHKTYKNGFFSLLCDTIDGIIHAGVSHSDPEESRPSSLEHIATYVISIQLYVSCLLRANRTKGPLHQCSDALDRRKKPGLDVHTHERIGKRDSCLGKISIHSFPDVQH